MPSLRELQAAFAAAILDGKSGPLPADRLRIYRNNVFLSFEGALKDVYPVLARLVGPQFFRQLARRFIREHPSRSGNLHDFGRELPRFVGELPEAAELPYLADVAALEWSWHESFHAADGIALDAQRLAAVPENELESLRLDLHPTVRLVASRYPVLAIWSANREANADAEIRLDAGGDFLLVARPELDVMVERASAGEFAFLEALADGMALGLACEAAYYAEPALDIGAAMARFVAGRIITGVAR
jgi:hypothetical protein